MHTGTWVLAGTFWINFTHNSPERQAVVIPILQMRKLRFRKVEDFAGE